MLVATTTSTFVEGKIVRIPPCSKHSIILLFSFLTNSSYLLHAHFGQFPNNVGLILLVLQTLWINLKKNFKNREKMIYKNGIEIEKFFLREVFRHVGMLMSTRMMEK